MKRGRRWKEIDARRRRNEGDAKGNPT